MTRRIIAAAMAFIMLISVFLLHDIPTAQAAGDYGVVKVLLSTSHGTSFSVTIAGEYSVKENPVINVSRGTCTVSLQGGALYINTGGVSTKVGKEITLVRHVGIAGQTNHITLANSRYGNTNYLGNIKFVILNNAIYVVNEVPVEEYLYGVVPYEMSNSMPLEALKAQAVAARGFTAYAIKTEPSATYQLQDYAIDQVYKGYNASNDRAIQAVNETAGQILTYDDEIIVLAYGASNGGQTELSGNAFVSNLPFYVHKDDPYDLANPYCEEDLSFIPATFNETTRALMDTIVLNKLESGAKTALNATNITLVSTTGVTPKDPKYPDPSRAYTKVDVTMQVRVGDAEETKEAVVTINLKDLVYSSSNKNGIFDKKYELRLKGAEAGTYTDDNGTTHEGFYLTNRGWGHGVGMSQRGAQQMAADGMLYSDILAFYYVNTEPQTIDTTVDALSVKPSMLEGIPAKCTGVDVNFRSGASTSSSSVEKIGKDAYLTITKLNYAEGWHQVCYNNMIGYVSSKYVSMLETGTYSLPCWLTLGGKTYYIKENGYATVGLAELDGKTYYFNSYGVLQTGWQTILNSKYYFDSAGVMQKGWLDWEQQRFYLNDTSGKLETGKIKVGTNTYITDKNGALLKGMITYSEKQYYANAEGVLQAGFLTVDGKLYYADPSTFALRTGVIQTEGGFYVADSKGVLYTGKFTYGTETYIADSKGKLMTGFVTWDGKKYYVKPASNAVQFGKLTVDGKTYITNADGVIQTGLINYETDLYYANEEGVLQSGTITVEGVTYTFDPTTYKALIDTATKLATNTFVIDEQREYVTGVARETKIEDFIKGFLNPAGTLRVVDAKGTPVTSGYIGTGMKIQCFVGEQVLDETTVCIRGDASGDGYIDVSDILAIQASILGKRTLTAAENKVADINADGFVDVNDILSIQADILGKSKIEK